MIGVLTISGVFGFIFICGVIMAVAERRLAHTRDH